MSIPPRTIPLTCVEDGRSHQVTDEEMAAGMRARIGSYRTLCGRTVTATFLIEPEGRPCTGCAVRATPPSRRERVGGTGRHRRGGVLRRLLARGLTFTVPTVPLSRPLERLPEQRGRAAAAAGPEAP